MNQPASGPPVLIFVDRVAMTLLVLAIAVAWALLVAKAAWGAAPPAADASSLLFDYLDANRDGVISLSEARRLRGFESAFRLADDNRDGRLSREEFGAAQAIFANSRGSGQDNDGLITLNVRNTLAQEESLHEFSIMVETYDGQVILGGRVDTPARARKVIDLATAVPGVESVKSTMEIRVRQPNQEFSAIRRAE